MIQEYSGMWLCCLPDKKPVGCGPYYYTVTTYGATAHTAFRTHAALLTWLRVRGLKTAEPTTSPEFDKQVTMRIVGTYRTHMHGDKEEFDSLLSSSANLEDLNVMSNGDYTLGFVTEEEGIRVIHYLNPNVRERQVYAHSTCRMLEDEGR